jgi:uncharacterized protein
MFAGKRRARRLPFLAVAALTGAALVALVAAGCGSGVEAKAGVDVGSGNQSSFLDTIIVSGVGQVTTLPDQATLMMSVETEGQTAAQALDANSKDTQTLLARLATEGVQKADIQTANVVVYPDQKYDQTTGKPTTTGYRAQNTVTVTFKDLKDLTLIAKVFAAATQAGADNVSGPNWMLKENSEAMNSALTKAVSNARSKAEALAAAQGVQLGEALILSESSAQQPIPYAMAEKAMPAGGAVDSVTPPPINPQTLDVTASVTVTYRMKR